MPPTCDICGSTTSPTAGAALGYSWSLFGRSWPLLGRFWVALGRFLAPLGRSRAALGTARKKQTKIETKNDRFGRPKALQNDAKSSQKTIQHINKTKRKRTELRRKSDPPNPQKY